MKKLSIRGWVPLKFESPIKPDKSSQMKWFLEQLQRQFRMLGRFTITHENEEIVSFENFLQILSFSNDPHIFVEGSGTLCGLLLSNGKARCDFSEIAKCIQWYIQKKYRRKMFDKLTKQLFGFSFSD
jgi:hypothetical protein